MIDGVKLPALCQVGNREDKREEELVKVRLTFRPVMEKAPQKKRNVFDVYGMKEVYDKVIKEGFWEVLILSGAPERLLDAVKSFRLEVVSL